MSGSLEGLLALPPLTVWELTSIISSLTALVAVIIGPIVQLYVAKRQIRSTTISANRQAWINSLRDNVSAVWACGSDVRTLRSAVTSDPVATTKIQEEIRQAKILINRIRLSINPEETDHQELVRLLEHLWAVADSVVPKDPKHEEWQKVQRDLMAVSRRILKDEWKRVKRGD